MEQTGEVISVKDDEIVVAFCRPTDCEKCGACQGSKNQTQLKIKGHAQVGDLAVVEMPTKNVIKASALAYGLPLVGLVGGLAVGYAIGRTNIFTGLFGIIGLSCSLLVIHLADHKIKNNAAWHPQLRRIISTNGED